METDKRTSPVGTFKNVDGSVFFTDSGQNRERLSSKLTGGKTGAKAKKESGKKEKTKKGRWGKREKTKGLRPFFKGTTRARARLCPPLGAGRSKKAFLRRRPFFAGSRAGIRPKHGRITKGKGPRWVVFFSENRWDVGSCSGRDR